MQRGEIVTWGEEDGPSELEGTPDGKVFYKVQGEGIRDGLRLELFYAGKWQRETVRKRGRMLYHNLTVDKRKIRPATEEEKAQLALARFME